MHLTSWTDTEIVSSVLSEFKAQVDKSVEQVNGKMTPEHVAEGFYLLVTQCENGSAMAVLKGLPYILVPDYKIFHMIMSMVTMAKILDKIFEPQVVTSNYQIIAFTAVFFLLLHNINWRIVKIWVRNKERDKKSMRGLL